MLAYKADPELKKKFVKEIEWHRRQDADWQNWVFQQCKVDEELNLTIPTHLVERWYRQIKTPYKDLSEREKQSDREQIDRYWPLIQTYVDKKCREARIEELNNIPPQYAELYEKFVTAKGYKDKKVPFTPFHEIIEDRLKALQQKGKK